MTPTQVRACASCRIRPAVVINDNPRFCGGNLLREDPRDSELAMRHSISENAPLVKDKAFCTQLLITKDQKTSLHWESRPGTANVGEHVHV